jgi:predicted transcriptional regulator
MKNKTQVSISIEIELRQKLDLYAKDTRRNRSQAVETLIAEYSIDKASVIDTQAKKIKELESELILLKSDTGVFTELPQELIEENNTLKKEKEDMRIEYLDLMERNNIAFSKLSNANKALKEIEEIAKNK